MLNRIIDGRTDLVFDYLAKGHPANSTDSDGVSLIAWCAYYGDVSAIRFLLANGETLESLGPNLDLNGAAFHGHWRLCQFLIENGADVNHSMPDTGETPLHVALCTPKRSAFVIESNPTVDVTASRNGVAAGEPLKQALTNSGRGHSAADHSVRILLANGAKPNCVTRPAVETGCLMRDARTRAETPLHRAAAFGSEEAIQMLLDAGAKINAKDMNGDSPLTWASWYQRPDSILRKLSYGSFSIHPERRPMGESLIGKPHV